MKVIYSRTVSVEMWSLGTFQANLTTCITEHEFLFLKWYRIHQNNPKIKNCFYDGEYSSNRLLYSVRNSEKMKARVWLYNYKQSNIINYEKESNKSNNEQKF